MTSGDLKVLDLKAEIVPIQLRCAWNDKLLHSMPPGRDIELILNTAFTASIDRAKSLGIWILGTARK